MTQEQPNILPAQTHAPRANPNAARCTLHAAAAPTPPPCSVTETERTPFNEPGKVAEHVRTVLVFREHG